MLVVTGRKVSCLSVGWEIGRRGGEDVLVNMNESRLPRMTTWLTG